MRGTSRHIVAFAITWIASACGTGNTNVDPSDLELRDLLGVSPDVVTTWDADQRSSARHVLADALDDDKAPTKTLSIDPYRSDDQLVRALAVVDNKRFDAGDDALALVHISGSELTPTRVSVATDARILDALAKAAGHEASEVTITREPRLAVAAAYIETTPPRLLVNPVVLAAFDEDGTTTDVVDRRGTTTSSSSSTGPARSSVKPTPLAANGNPYSFYGSVAECAYAQKLRCEACLPSSSCNDAVTSSDANAECTKLAEGGGRGYFLLCINLSLSITSVEQCAADTVGSCTRNTNAANDLTQLEANANFLDDMACGTGLDECLAKIYGAPNTTFPGVDGGTSVEPPRNPDVTCGDSCSDNNSNCEASPSCNCDGPSCNNSLSCDSTCASSNDQSGCGGGCDSCSSDNGGDTSGGGCGGSSGGGTSSGGGCGGSSGGGTSGSDGCGGCSSDSSSSSSGGGCGGCSSDSSSSSSSGGGCGGCSSDSSSSSSSGGCSGGGGGGSSCQVAQREPSAVFAVAFSLGWAFLPIPVAAVIRRRSRKKKKRAASDGEAAQEVSP